MYFFISSLISWLTHSLCISMLFNLHVFVFFPDFFLWSISSFLALWSEKMHGMTLIFLNLLRPDLWCDMWSILENVLYTLEKDVYGESLLLYGYWQIRKWRPREVKSFAWVHTAKTWQSQDLSSCFFPFWGGALQVPGTVLGRAGCLVGGRAGLSPRPPRRSMLVEQQAGLRPSDRCLTHQVEVGRWGWGDNDLQQCQLAFGDILQK